MTDRTYSLIAVKNGMLEILSHGFATGSRSDTAGHASDEDDAYGSQMFAGINGT
jgi:hypothetical protein